MVTGTFLNSEFNRIGDPGQSTGLMRKPKYSKRVIPEILKLLVLF